MWNVNGTSEWVTATIKRSRKKSILKLYYFYAKYISCEACLRFRWISFYFAFRSGAWVSFWLVPSFFSRCNNTKFDFHLLNNEKRTADTQKGRCEAEKYSSYGAHLLSSSFFSLSHFSFITFYSFHFHYSYKTHTIHMTRAFRWLNKRTILPERKMLSGAPDENHMNDQRDRCHYIFHFSRVKSEEMRVKSKRNESDRDEWKKMKHHYYHQQQKQPSHVAATICRTEVAHRISYKRKK